MNIADNRNGQKVENTSTGAGLGTYRFSEVIRRLPDWSSETSEDTNTSEVIAEPSEKPEQPGRQLQPQIPAVGSARRQVITQECLAEYHDLKERCSQVQEELKVLREELLDLDENGAKIEPGPLTVEVRYVEQRPLTKANLTALLGETEFERLRRQVAPVERISVYVKASGESKPNKRK